MFAGIERRTPKTPLSATVDPWLPGSDPQPHTLIHLYTIQDRLGRSLGIFIDHRCLPIVDGDGLAGVGGPILLGFVVDRFNRFIFIFIASLASEASDTVMLRVKDIQEGVCGMMEVVVATIAFSDACQAVTK
ncbi:uroporphyrinogen III synthase [Anopheles sinensis]|uniref:Uroporphyrinogen III synthase n=1 Tax=Anopheles sinensis TaxID=74873 RepID=A0A084WGT5_ANOSI|nr:uroporphyrinogen III synthase [Anopheles sinensis]